MFQSTWEFDLPSPTGCYRWSDHLLCVLGVGSQGESDGGSCLHSLPRWHKVTLEDINEMGKTDAIRLSTRTPGKPGQVNQSGE